MSGFFKVLFSDKITYWSFLITSALLFFSLLIIVLSYRKLPPFVPLFNQLPWGMERLGEKNQIIIPLGIAIGVFALNSVLSNYLHKNMPLVSRIIAFTSAVIAFLTLLFLFRTTQIIL